MPDEISGPQVHFLYIVPSDGADRQLDTNEVMEQSVARIERWFVTQAGTQGLRIDTYNGAPDITFVRMPHSAAQATAVNPWPLWVIGEDLVAAGFNNPAKVYAAFYDGPSTWACGGAKSPALPKLGAMYLRAQPTDDPRPCSDAPGFGTGADRPGYFEIGLLHEIMHVIGFSPSCAPHASESAFPDHVHDSPTDLMYGPDARSHRGLELGERRSRLQPRRLLPGQHPRVSRSVEQPVPGDPAFPLRHGERPRHGDEQPQGNRLSRCLQGNVPRFGHAYSDPSAGAAFSGWTGTCSGTATCDVAGEGSASASFSALSHRRTLTLRVRGLRATGALRVLDGYEQCRERVPVIVERRGKQGWSIIRRVRTDKAGLFTAPLPKGRATYRARAPELMANGERCVATVSRTARSSSRPVRSGRSSGNT